MSYEDPEKRRARNRRYYEKNVDRESKRSRVKTQRLILQVKALLLEHLLTHPCVDCGERDPVVLEFDHIDPRQKRFTMAEARRGKRRPALVYQELIKCEVRCANCHRRRTFRQALAGEIKFGFKIREITPEASGTAATKAPSGKL